MMMMMERHPVSEMIFCTTLRRKRENFSVDSNTPATRLRAGRSGLLIPIWARDFSLLRNAQSGSGAHPAPCLVGTPGLLLRHRPVGA